MKRLLLVIVLVSLATMGFAVDFGFGASGAFGSWDLTESAVGLQQDLLQTVTPYNFMAYVDFGYIQFSGGYRIFRGLHQKFTDLTGSATEADFDKVSGNFLSLSIFAKYPVRLGSITVFPMIGIEYNYTVSGTYADGTALTSTDKSDLNEFWIKGGLGLDVSVSPQMYVRPELTVGYKLHNKPDNDAIALDHSLGIDAKIITVDVELAILLGFRL